jgi:hypothetical protein
MKILELTNKILLPITNEERDLLERFEGDEPIAKNQLDEREQVVANQLTVKDVLLRTNDAGKIYYKKQIS